MVDGTARAESLGGDGCTGVVDCPESVPNGFHLPEWMLSTTSEAVVAVRGDTRITYWNPAAERLYGVAAADAIGRRLRECFEFRFESPEQRKRALQEFRERGTWRGDNIHVTRSGRPMAVAVTVNAIPEEAGGGFFAMIRDIRLRKGWETALRASEERERARTLELETLMRAAPAVIWISHDPECRVISGNPAANRLLDLPEGVNPSATGPEGRDRRWREFRDGVEIPGGELPMQIAAQGTEVRDAELSLVFDDGEIRHILGNASPLRDRRGQVTGSIGAFVDITARKNAEDALQDALRRKDEFLAMLAHELRNPLGAITHALELMRISGAPDAPATWEFGVVERQVAHLSRIVDDLLDVSRLTRGRIQLKKEPVPVKVAVDLAVETSRSFVDARGQRIIASVPETIWVNADVNRLAQIVANLLSNASRYSPEGSRIWLSLDSEGPDAVIRVRDEGIGIPSDIRCQIFEPFHRGQAALDRTDGGLGLGLTLVRSLTVLHGGTVDVESRGAGLGSEFIVRLPAVPPAVEKVAPPEADVPGRGWRVLVVDDNVDCAVGLARLLETSGHRVQLAHEGRSALRVAAEFRPDVAVLDIGLPGMDGYELARHLREGPATSSIRLVAVTGYGQPQDRRRALQAGFDQHVVKPVRADALLATFAALIPREARLSAASPAPPSA